MKVPTTIALAALAAATTTNASVLFLGDGLSLLTPTGSATVAQYTSPWTVDDQGNFTALVESAVVYNASDANFGGLPSTSFFYKLYNDPTSLRELNGLSVKILGGAAPAMNNDAEPLVPNVADATYASSGMKVAGFLWVTDFIAAGENSSWVSVTIPIESMKWKIDVVGVYDGTTEDVKAIVPVVPEPTVYAGLFALGLAGFAAYRRFSA